LAITNPPCSAVSAIAELLVIMLHWYTGDLQRGIILLVGFMSE